MGSGFIELYGQADVVHHEALNADGCYRVAIGRKLWLPDGNFSLDLWFHEESLQTNSTGNG
jgi:hypothetical protein